MLDLSKLSEMVGGLFNGPNSITGTALGNALGGAEGIQGILSTAGIDIESLAGLTPDQVANVLSENGIDPASLAPEDITNLMQQLGLDNPLVSAVANMWGNVDQGAR